MPEKDTYRRFEIHSSSHAVYRYYQERLYVHTIPSSCYPAPAAGRFGARESGPPLRNFDWGGQTFPSGKLAVTNTGYFHTFS